MIEVVSVTKDYGTVVALRDVSFRVAKGEVVGFLGPNGAGKSTTLRILAGFLGATAGTVTIDGYDAARDPLAAKSRVGYMPEAAPLYPEMRVREYLDFRARLKRVPRAKRRETVAQVMDQVAVADVADTLIGHLSKGYRQRVALSDALLGAPPLLILDEPTAGLDPNQNREVRKLIRELGKTHTILLSTHILSEVEATCDRAVVIHRGQIVAEGTLSELLSRGREKSLLASVCDREGVAASLAREVAGVAEVLCVGSEDEVVSLEIRSSARAEEVAERLVETWVRAGVRVRSITNGKASLDEVFAELTDEPASSKEKSA